jgi:hypothetical protein
MKISRSSLTRIGSIFSLGMALCLAGSSRLNQLRSGQLGRQSSLSHKAARPAFKGTPKDIQLSTYVEPLSDKPRPPMMVPAGLKNIAPGSKITCSDKNARRRPWQNHRWG